MHAHDSQNARIVAGLSAGAWRLSLQIAGRVLLVPLFVSVWGVEAYGEWLLLGSLVSFLVLTDLGLRGVIANPLTRLLAKGDLDGLRETLHTGLAIGLLLPAATLTLFWLAAAAASPLEALGILKTPAWTALAVLALGGIRTHAAMLRGLLLEVYRATGAYARGAAIWNSNLLTSVLLVALSLGAGAGMLVVAFVELVPILLGTWTCSRELRREHPELEIGRLEAARLSLAREFVRPGLHYLLANASLLCATSGPVLLAGQVGTAVDVVLLSTSRTLANLIKQVLAHGLQSVRYEMTRLDAEGRKQELETLFGGVLRTALLACASCAAGLHFFGAWVFEIWLRGRVVFDPLLMDVILAGLLLHTVWYCCLQALMALNRHERAAQLTALSTGLSLAFALVLGSRHGVVGIASGMVLGDLALIAWALPALMRRYHGGFSPRFFLRELAPWVAAGFLIELVPVSAPLWIAAMSARWYRTIGAARDDS